MELPPAWGQNFVWFYNWTDFDFTYPWNKEDYTFKSKQKMRLQEGIAYHFAKHLAEFWYNKDNKKYNLAELDQQIEKGLIREDAPQGMSAEKMKIMAANEFVQDEAKSVIEKPAEPEKVKRGRPKKVKEEDLAQFEGK